MRSRCVRCGASCVLIALVLATASPARAQNTSQGEESALGAEGPGKVVTARISALFQVDTVLFDGEGIARSESGMILRRGRVGLEGTVGRSLDYNFNVEMGGAEGEKRGRIQSVWLQYRGTDQVRFRAGVFAPSQGFEGAASSMLFPERASPTNLVRSLAGGSGPKAVGLFANGKSWSASAGLSAGPLYGSNGPDPLAIVTRATVLPLNLADRKLHLGAYATNLVKTAGGVRLRERPETRVGTLRLVDSGSIDASSALATGGEIGFQSGPLTLQAEYVRVKLDRNGRGVDPSFSGWYLIGAWTLTGEQRPYRVANGSFANPTPATPLSPARGRWGALELGTRLSRLDLNYNRDGGSEAITDTAVRGGKQMIFSLVLNWYPDDRMRFQIGAQRITAGGSSAVGARARHTIRSLSIRAQYSL